MVLNQTTCKVQKWLEQTGSSWMPVDEMPDLEIAEEVQKGNLVVRQKGNRLFTTLPFYKKMEYFIARNICARLYHQIEVDHQRVDELIDEYEMTQSSQLGFPFRFCDEQREGIHMLVSCRIGILTGGPGTGKTSVLQCTAFVLKRIAGRHIVIQFTAPTGKAARRITEASGYPATTIQKYTGGSNGNKINIMCPDYLFCDEFSMADEDTLETMLRSLMPMTNIYLIGDINQLPSVGIGAVLRDLIDCRLIPYVQLIKTFRQDNDSVLFNNIQIVNEGGNIPLEDGLDFKNIRTEENVFDNCIKEYLTGVEKYGLENSVILTAYRKEGVISSEKLNLKIQGILNPTSNGKPFLKTRVLRDDERWVPITFKEGDPVIQLVNNDKVANGDVGKIISVQKGKVTVKFSDCTISYYGAKLNELELAYALSVHKSQGSEYACVVLPLLKQNCNLDRNLIYTGISRAKKYCVIIGEDEVVQNACKIQSSWNRITFLCEEFEIYHRALEIRLQIVENASQN